MELEKFWETININDEMKLQEYFYNTREFGGIPIIKDNCEDLFENWSQGLTLEEINNILK